MIGRSGSGLPLMTGAPVKNANYFMEKYSTMMIPSGQRVYRLFMKDAAAGSVHYLKKIFKKEDYRFLIVKIYAAKLH